MNTRKFYPLLILILIVGCGPADDGFTDLFNGKSLDGWHSYGKDEINDGWYADNGELIFDFQRDKSGENSNLVTDKQYTNYELSIEWKIYPHGNSGIFWGVIESEEFEQPYMTGPEIQILDDGWEAYIEERGDINRAGSLYGLIPPSSIVSNPAEEWNHYLIHIDHKENEGFVVFNGTEVVRFPVHGPEWKAMIAKSGFAKWSSFGTAKTGHISLQEWGGKVAFRNIKIKELP
ncbi:DUF1080 domain-containing protein [Maribacter sp. HTCC2170]|uniref:3-keto-disaccharide hydrolase n=1 Tax=Maribacter sp. (strain HTCC2170 / KCCM 42371) TaxID=313603 RepID=UPI00006B4968|nr:DUF1080 domain-containing protein [Maribacter sp. HTCC2170]EAR00984.1 probable secreted glycosyl hydrolase [Maribacter sp. HTCC2170]